MTEQVPTEEPQSTPESHLQSSTSVTPPQSPSESPLSPHPPPVSPKRPKWALSTSLSVAGPQQGTLTLREGPVQQHAGYLKRRTSVLKRWKEEVFEIVPGKRYQNEVSRLQTQKLSANCIQIIAAKLALGLFMLYDLLPWLTAGLGGCMNH